MQRALPREHRLGQSPSRVERHFVRLTLEWVEDRSLLSLFGAPTVYPTNTRAVFSEAAVGDYNGDGKPDLAIANGYGPTLSMLLNQGSGTFAPAVNYPLGFGPYSLAAADFNGDGKLDLATASLDTDTVRVMLGQGDGTFALPFSLPTGINPLSVAVGDFNGDGRTDLVASNWPEGTVSEYLNRGNGIFAPPVYYPAASPAARVTVTDLNGDGKPDLILAGHDQMPAVRGAVTVLLNRGAGTFGPPTTYVTLQGADGPPITVNRPAVADFNLDGKPDEQPVPVKKQHSIIGDLGPACSRLLRDARTGRSAGRTVRDRPQLTVRGNLCFPFAQPGLSRLCHLL